MIPTRDRWARLSVAVETVLRQRDVTTEIVVVDDGSVDGTATRLAELAVPELRVIRHETSRGVARARNAGIGEARGRWVAFLDDDDFWAPSKLRGQLDVAADADFGYAGAVRVDEDRRPLEVLAPPDPNDLARLLFASNPIPAGCSNMLVKTSLLRRLEGFDEGLSHLADWDLWLRLALEGRAAASTDVLVGYVEHPGNMQLVETDTVRREARSLFAKHARVAAERGAAFDELDLSRWIGWSHQRAGRRFRAFAEHMRAGVRHRSRADIGYGLRALVRGATPPVHVDASVPSLRWLSELPPAVREAPEQMHEDARAPLR